MTVDASGIDQLISDPALIMLNLEVESDEQALALLAHRLLDEGFVRESFPRAVVEREREFPTGLPMSPIGVAIPHADAEHVLRTTVALATLRRPVPFRQMGDPEEHIDVRVMFMLAVAEPKAQVVYLSRVVGAIQSVSLLSRLIAAEQREDAITALEEAVDGTD